MVNFLVQCGFTDMALKNLDSDLGHRQNSTFSALALALLIFHVDVGQMGTQLWSF